MKHWIVDLCSFGVEAETIEEAEKKAIEMLESGEETPQIDAIRRHLTFRPRWQS